MTRQGTKVAQVTREDAIFIADSFILDGEHEELVLNAASIVLEFEDDRVRGRDDSGTKPFVVTQSQAEDIANKFKIAGPAQHLALSMWRLVLQWRLCVDGPELPDADPTHDIAYNPFLHHFVIT